MTIGQPRGMANANVATAALSGLAAQPREVTLANRATAALPGWSVSIPLEPVAKGRPRMSPAEYATGPDGERVKVRKASVYTPADTDDFEHKVRWYLRAGRVTALDGDLRVDVTFRYTPKHSRKYAHDDADNMIKALFDATNKIGWTDDKQVSEIHCYLQACQPGEQPGIDYTVTTLPSGTPGI